ncbi:MAG TPA: glycosyltransferase family 4 protein [Candidatus Brocadiaceae bacterium]
MKILQVNNYHYLRGGSERVYFETSKLLEENGHTVIHFSVKDTDSFDSPFKGYFVDPVTYFKSGLLNKTKNVFKFIYSRDAKNKFEELIKNEKPDIVHLHIFYGRLTSSILPVLKKYSIPAVMTVHEYKMLCPVYNFLNNEGKICEKCANSCYYHCVIHKCNKGDLFYSSVSALESYIRDKCFPYEKYIGRFIMVSKFVLTKHLQYRPQIQNKAIQVSNFVNVEEYTPNYSPGNYYLYVGRISKEKGILTLLKAWKHLANIALKIVGDGDYKDQIIRYIKENNINNVELVGYLTGKQLFEIVRNSKYMIAPSECFETFGLNIIEGFACGKPSIASKIGAIPELVQDGINGFLFESGNVDSLVKTIKLAEDTPGEKYLEMAISARNLVENNFNKEIYYKRLMGVYQEAILNDFK